MSRSFKFNGSMSTAAREWCMENFGFSGKWAWKAIESFYWEPDFRIIITIFNEDDAAWFKLTWIEHSEEVVFYITDKMPL